MTSEIDDRSKKHPYLRGVVRKLNQLNTILENIFYTKFGERFRRYDIDHRLRLYDEGRSDLEESSDDAFRMSCIVYNFEMSEGDRDERDVLRNALVQGSTGCLSRRYSRDKFEKGLMRVISELTASIADSRPAERYPGFSRTNRSMRKYCKETSQREQKKLDFAKSLLKESFATSYADRSPQEPPTTFPLEVNQEEWVKIRDRILKPSNEG